MRRGNKPQWVYLPNGDLAGIAMGSDFCAEHEWGIDRMRQQMGCDVNKDGVERRQMSTVPKDLQMFSGVAEQTDWKGRTNKKIKVPYDAIFLSPTESYYRKPTEWVKDGELHRYEDAGLCCAWDEKTFGIVAYGDKDKANLKILWEAFQQKNVAFWPNIGVFHLGSGLVFCIVSRVPEEDKKKMLESDLDHKELLLQSAAIGIEDELKKAGKSFMALSPRWVEPGFKGTTNDKIGETKYKVYYWLNPNDQQNNNWGWTTVEELKLWAQNKGPLIKSEAQKRAYRDH